MYFFEWSFGNWKFGPVCALEENDHIVRIGLCGALGVSAREYLSGKSHFEDPVKRQTPALRELKIQLNEYFKAKRKEFDLPLALEGSDFQMKVWRRLQKIPYGCLVSYGQVAKDIGKAKAAIAVGQAVANVPLPIIIPCHRVIGASGKLTGYGYGLGAKRALLDLEGAKYEV